MIQNKKITRKQFLLLCMLSVAGAFTSKFTSWFTPKDVKTSGSKEAMFYRSSNDLVG